jgi:hypothetical protein
VRIGAGSDTVNCAGPVLPAASLMVTVEVAVAIEGIVKAVPGKLPVELVASAGVCRQRWCSQRIPRTSPSMHGM